MSKPPRNDVADRVVVDFADLEVEPPIKVPELPEEPGPKLADPLLAPPDRA